MKHEASDLGVLRYVIHVTLRMNAIFGPITAGALSGSFPFIAVGLVLLVSCCYSCYVKRYSTIICTSTSLQAKYYMIWS